jgi:hypothetical protein
MGGSHASTSPPALTLTTEPLRLLSPPLENPSVAEIGGGGVELEGLMSIAPTPTPEDHVAALRGRRGEVPLRPGDALVSAIPAANGLPLLSSEPPDPPDPDPPLEVVGRELVLLAWRFRPMTGARGIRMLPFPAFTAAESSDCECGGSCG